MGTTYSPFRGNQLLSQISGAVQQAMQMKKQQEQQDKMQEQAFKQHIKQVEMEHKIQKQFAEWKAGFEKTQREAERQAEIERNMAAVQRYASANIQDQNAMGPNIPDNFGMQFSLNEQAQNILPAMQYGAQINQPVKTGELLNATVNNPMKYLTQLEAINKRGENTLQNIEKKITGQKEMLGQKIGSTEGIKAADRVSRERIRAADRASREGIERDRNALRITLNNQKLGYSNQIAEQQAENAARNLLERRVKAIANKEPVTSEHIAKAIQQLSVQYPNDFGQYFQIIEQKEPGFLSKITFGLLGGSKPTLKGLSGLSQPVAVKPLNQYSW